MLKYLSATLCGLTLLMPVAQAQDFALSSKSIEPNVSFPMQQVFNGFGCTGENVSPELSWTSGPTGTKSYAITVYDPDAPTGSGWWHWVVYNIPSSARELVVGAGREHGVILPKGSVQGRNDFGVYGYGGPCPPVGDKAHRYVFTLYALKTAKLDLPKEASAAMIGFMIHANTLAKTDFVAKYGRQ